MATAVLTKPTRKVANVHVRLFEDLAYGAGGIGQVDKSAGIIRRAKIVGLESRNIGRTIGLDSKVFGDAVDKPYGYSRRALESAIPMYEGATIRIDHPQSEIDATGRRRITQRSRPAMATSGVLRNVTLEADGLYGDIHLFLTHPQTAFILEVAERAPSKLACSHNADGTPVLINGRAVIDKINQVFSVDIVGDKPGTTNGLFEDYLEHSEMPKTISQLLETLPANAIGRTFLLEMAPEMYSGKKVAEMDMMPKMGGQAAMNPNPQAQVGDALRTVVMAIYDDPAIDDMAKMSKLKEIFKLKSKLEGNTNPAIDGGDVSAEDTETDSENPFGKTDDSAEGSEKKPKTKSTEETDAGSEADDESTLEESMATAAKDPKFVQLLETVAELKAENVELKASNHARNLLETMEREITEVRVEAVKALKTDDARKALIETWNKKGVAAPKPTFQIMESNAGEQPETAESFARSVRGTNGIR